MDLHQTLEWGEYLSAIKWQAIWVGQTLILLKRVPWLNFSVIKIQRAGNPLPFSQIDEIAKEYKALFVIAEPHSKNYQEELFKKNSFHKSNIILAHTATIKIPTNKTELEIWKSLSENARRNIKKSQKENLRIERIVLSQEKDDKKFDDFYALLKNLTQMKNFYVPGYDEFYKKMLAFKKVSTIFFAYSGRSEKPIATVWYLNISNTLHYLHTGITTEGYERLANYLLVWEGLKTARELKLEYLDFEGIYDPRFPSERKKWANFSEFKKRFHGETIEFPRPWIKIYNVWFKLFYLCTTIFSK